MLFCSILISLPCSGKDDPDRSTTAWRPCGLQVTQFQGDFLRFGDIQKMPQQIHTSQENSRSDYLVPTAWPQIYNLLLNFVLPIDIYIEANDSVCEFN